ncbi:MAG TPA: hypothetical protein VMD28_03210, partial [Acidimicrobiales bacterium]|nr:hypothetical protein [Acidimicrobiales bacterium]
MRRARWFVGGAVAASFAVAASLSLPPVVGASRASHSSTPMITYKSFTRTFSVMKELAGIAKEGKGKI